MNPERNFDEIDFRCFQCDTVQHGIQSFVRHHRNVIHNPPFQCAYCQEGVLEHFTSLVRHIKQTHPNGEGGDSSSDSDIDDDNDGSMDIEEYAYQGGEQVEDSAAEGEEGIPEGEATGGQDVLQDLCKAAALCTLNLRQSSGITTSAIERFQVQCNQMIQSVTANNLIKVKEFLAAEGIDTPASRALLLEFPIKDPFESVRTLKQQLNYFAREFGMVKPQTKFLHYRQDSILNPVTAQHEPAQVPSSFEYVSVIETLTSALSNPKIRNLIASERPSDDGVLRSFLDGSRVQSHPLVNRYPNILRIVLCWDDVEVVNPLGSKTSIHKLAAFYFAIQNLPGVESSQLSSIFLLILAHSEDMKICGAFEKVLQPFLNEMKQLESSKGVTITVDNEPFVLRATLTVLVADTLAAHDILGLLAPGANCFCRKCLVTRAELHQDCNAMGVRRTKAMFEEHVRLVSERAAFSTQCGVRKDCPLHMTTHFDATEDSVFDIFHDLLEGVCQWDMALALRSFATGNNKLISVKGFNERISAFNYGVMDIKNKPSPNFTDASLTGKTMKQTGSQVWCLNRAFGFLVPEVPENDNHLKLVNLIQKIMLIVFSDAVRPEHIDELEVLIESHNTLYQQLHMPDDLEILEEENEEDPGGAEVDDPNLYNRTRVTPGNKMHHMKHYPEEMRKFGPLFRYWCARFEGRHQIFSKYGAVCCNFINPPKSMAQMFQMSTLSGLQDSSLRQEDLEVLGASPIPVEESDHHELLINAGLVPGNMVEIANTVKIAGEQYRPGNFVLLESTQPAFGLIHRVYVSGTQVTFIVQPWLTVGFVDRYCAYEVRPLEGSQLMSKQHKQLARHGCFTPWNPWKIRTTFIAPRTIIF